MQRPLTRLGLTTVCFLTWSGFSHGENNVKVDTPCTAGQVVKWNGSKWVCSADLNSGGTVTTVNSGTGLVGGPITTTGTLSLDTAYTDSRYDSRYVRFPRGPSFRWGAEANCTGQPRPGTFPTIAAALAEARRWTGYFDILVRGTCHESVTIDRSQTTLASATAEEGEPPGRDGIDAVSPSSTLITVDAVGVDVQSLTLTGGVFGLRVLGGASVRTNVLTIENANVGVEVQAGATAILAGTTVRDCPFRGIHVRGGTLELDGSTLEHNGEGIVADQGRITTRNAMIQGSSLWGLYLDFGSSAWLSEGSVHNNGNSGLILRGSTLNLRHTTVEGNSGRGIEARNGSSINLVAGAVVESNLQGGIRLGDVSVAEVSSDSAVRNNTGIGIACAGSPAVAQLILFGSPTLTGNTGGAHDCPLSPN